MLLALADKTSDNKKGENMKGVIICAGKSTRSFPATLRISKQFKDHPKYQELKKSFDKVIEKICQCHMPPDRKEVEKYLNPRAQTRDKYYYDLYQLFWEEYLELKKNGKYNENSIMPSDRTF